MDLLNFRVESDLSGRAKCRSCHERIPESYLLVSKRDTDGTFHWTGAYKKNIFGHFHLDCFSNDREEHRFPENATTIPGIDRLIPCERVEVKIALDLGEIDSNDLSSDEYDEYLEFSETDAVLKRKCEEDEEKENERGEMGESSKKHKK